MIAGLQKQQRRSRGFQNQTSSPGDGPGSLGSDGNKMPPTSSSQNTKLELMCTTKF
ncbi:Hypothetical protein FKW44_018320 [Caligus rogercresseyi]|uniref:Uncharacterized protein n=1 Tax=Caligus rogercresseyi TaxID=217165 RepID=A0A7T8GU83_CALRO|nr:Hypothetical protein FKW44_018320 [Caligus rogercresseyi]